MMIIKRTFKVVSTSAASAVAAPQQENKMDRIRNAQARCPGCGCHGRSVAAMNYAETWRWHKSGSVSGSGLGIAMGGPGIGLGGGTYSEHGEIKSKRADVFDEPRRYALPVLSVILIGGFLAASVAHWPSMMLMMTDGVSPAPAGRAADLIQESSSALVYLAPLAAMVLLAVVFYRAWINLNEEARLNTEVFPGRIERYNELRYCEACNRLYDIAGRSESGSELGFERMMLEAQVGPSASPPSPGHVVPTTQGRIR